MALIQQDSYDRLKISRLYHPTNPSEVNNNTVVLLVDRNWTQIRGHIGQLEIMLVTQYLGLQTVAWESPGVGSWGKFGKGMELSGDVML